MWHLLFAYKHRKERSTNNNGGLAFTFMSVFGGKPCGVLVDALSIRLKIDNEKQKITCLSYLQTFIVELEIKQRKGNNESGFQWTNETNDSV